MKDIENIIVNQLKEYSQTIVNAEQEIIEIEKLLMEKRKVLEQYRGGYTAIFNLGISQGIIDQQGNIIAKKDK